ncbi:MAG TPA: hypothetical protein VE523_09945 [Solirubrobacterales bacterium]|jgi:hypothetical protein|nr:hypothetical protein [Solirubrobacterales bacterium]
MALGRVNQGSRTVSLEAGAVPGGPRCPACGAPLFVWVETRGWGPREDQVIDRCENCGLAVPRDAVPDPDGAAAELTGSHGADAADRLTLRAPNAASVQAWLGAENWAALRPGERELKPSPRSAELLLAKRGLGVGRVRHLAAPGMASMWQTLLNLLTFHRNFASEAISGRLRPSEGRGRAAYAIDVMVTVLAAVPTAILAVLIEGAAVLARRGGVIEIEANFLPDPERPASDAKPA